MTLIAAVLFAPFAGGAPSLIFSNGRDLLIGDIHGNNLRTLVNSQNRGVAVGVDFHSGLNRIFWTDTIQNKVSSSHFSILSYFHPVHLLRSGLVFCFTERFGLTGTGHY